MLKSSLFENMISRGLTLLYPVYNYTSNFLYISIWRFIVTVLGQPIAMDVRVIYQLISGFMLACRLCFVLRLFALLTRLIARTGKKIEIFKMCFLPS